MILNEELIEEASENEAIQYLIVDEHELTSVDRKQSFKAGVSWCRKFYEDVITGLIAENQGLKMNQDLAVEFLIWYMTSDIQNKQLKFGLPQMGKNFDVNLLAKELFEEFLKQK